MLHVPLLVLQERDGKQLPVMQQNNSCFIETKAKPNNSVH